MVLKTEDQHLQDAKDWIMSDHLENEWAAIEYSEHRNRYHYINMKHLVCGTISSNRKDRSRIYTCKNKMCIRKKTQATCQEKYGVDSPFQSPEIQEKIKETNLKKYGVENVFSLKQFRADPLMGWTSEAIAKREETLQKRYGVRQLKDIEGISEKIRASQMQDFIPRNEEQMVAIKSAESLREFILKLENKPNFLELSSLLGIQASRCAIYVDRYELRDLISTNYGRSAAEKEIEKFLIDLGLKVISSWRGLGSTKREIDLFLPDLNIGIEYNGLYWHSTLYRDRLYHSQKTLFARKKGIHLIHIYEDEWRLKQEIVKNKIRLLTDRLPREVYAHNCIVEKLSDEKTNIFLDQYHLQGANQADFSYGLYNREILVAVMSFNQSRAAEEEGKFELSRFVSSQIIIGGFDKLLSYFLKQVSVKEIYTYIDLRWSDPKNNIYLNNNFSLVEISEPTCFYLLNKNGEPGFSIRVKESNFIKNNCLELFPDASPDLTKQEIMENYGYSRIYDCGAAKFSLKIKGDNG
jgi:hypothetical protein